MLYLIRSLEKATKAPAARRGLGVVRLADAAKAATYA